MKAFPERKIHFWGSDYNVSPILLDGKIGDGKKVMYFEFMDDRPFYYVVRADSEIKEGMDEFIEMIESIRELIEDESMCIMTDEQYDEYEQKGWPEETRDFPIPPYCSCGYSWGDYTPCKAEIRLMDKMCGVDGKI